MEKRIKTKINKYFINFKQSLDEKISELNLSPKATAELREYIYNFPELNISKDDFAKRKRTKNTIPSYERCNAKRANGEQCTRKKKGENSLCGTIINIFRKIIRDTYIYIYIPHPNKKWTPPPTQKKSACY